MARSTEDDSLEPILPRHPPTAPIDPVPRTEGDVEVASAASGAASPRRPWERWLALACAVVATLSLVVCALRLNAIAADQRIEACQVEAFIEQQLASNRSRGIDIDETSFRDKLADCIGVDPDADAGSSSGD